VIKLLWVADALRWRHRNGGCQRGWVPLAVENEMRPLAPSKQRGAPVCVIRRLWVGLGVRPARGRVPRSRVGAEEVPAAVGVRQNVKVAVAVLPNVGVLAKVWHLRQLSTSGCAGAVWMGGRG